MHYTSLSISFIAAGPHQTEKSFSFPAAAIFPLLNTIFQQKTSGKWKKGQTATKNCK
jgi:hypothetical protein